MPRARICWALGGKPRKASFCPRRTAPWASGIGWEPVDVADWVQADVGQYGGKEHMLARAKSLRTDAPALQIDDLVDALTGKQLEASGMDAGQCRDRLTAVEVKDNG